jgi:hypothetical protein
MLHIHYSYVIVKFGSCKFASYVWTNLRVLKGILKNFEK